METKIQRRKAAPAGAEKNLQDRPPNFRADNGRFFLVRCFACEPERETNGCSTTLRPLRLRASPARRLGRFLTDSEI